MSESPSPTRTLLWWPAAGAGLLVFALATYTLADPDLWGHVRFGLDLLRTHALPSVDPYSFTQDRAWVNHEWLSELQMAVAWVAGKGAGLALLKGLLVFAAFLVVWRSWAGVALPLRLGAMLVMVLGTARMVQTLRPQLWTLVFLVLLCRALLATSPGPRRLLPLLFAVWANCHGGWIVGLAVLGFWALAEVVTTRQDLREWSILLVACAAATLATPYGWSLWTFMAGTVRMTRAIGEWQPLWTISPIAWVPWVATGVAAAAMLARRREPHRLAIALVVLALGYGAVKVERLLPLFVAAGVMLLGGAFARRWPARPLLPPTPTRTDILTARAIFVLGLAAAVAIGAATLRCIPVRGTWVPDAAVARLLDGADAGRLVVFFDWGQYAIWHWGGKLRVSMDGRRETVYSHGRLEEHQAILDGRPAGLAALDRWRAEYVWLPASSVATRDWLATHGYRIELVTERSFLAVRGDILRPPMSKAAENGRERCFPK